MFRDCFMYVQTGASRSLLLTAVAPALLLTGCGSGTSPTAAAVTSTSTPPTSTPPTSTPPTSTPPASTPPTSTPPVSTPPTSTPSSPAALTYISPGAVMVGTAGMGVALQGSGISSGATVLMDGTVHTASFVSSSEIDVPLTAAELATAERHAFSVQNPQATTSAAKNLLVSSGYNAFGDSITAGANLSSPSTQNYTALLAAALKIEETNNALGGDQACDVFPRQIFRSGTGYSSQPAALQSLMVGTNDVDFRGPGYFEPVFNTCYQAALAWLGTPRESRLMAGDSGFSTTGACTNAASAAHFGGLACTAAGTIAATLTTSGNAIYIWYTLSESDTPANFQVALDGVTTGTYYMLSANSINTYNGTHTSVALLRLPAAAGSHAISITTTTGNVGFQGIGSNPATGTNLPLVLAGDLPNQYLQAPWAPAASQLVYSADIAANVSLIALDGVDVRLAPTRAYMPGTADVMTDSLHPNALGQQELEAAFLSVLP